MAHEHGDPVGDAPEAASGTGVYDELVRNAFELAERADSEPLELGSDS